MVRTKDAEERCVENDSLGDNMTSLLKKQDNETWLSYGQFNSILGKLPEDNHPSNTIKKLRTLYLHHLISDLKPLRKIYRRKVYFNLKRLFDLIVGASFLLIFSPLMLLAAILIKLDSSKGPVFFRQKRIGKNFQIFSIWKFRTMYELSLIHI